MCSQFGMAWSSFQLADLHGLGSAVDAQDIGWGDSTAIHKDVGVSRSPGIGRFKAVVGGDMRSSFRFSISYKS